ncbi:hypothetical protein [Frateuria defendens]|uniref:hypothetical protein n=1 Tax=Frateuria defendens TaxID=2219559 RepID=UPI00066FBC4C|nr:hypothetical protein [Frateuria defendens]
MAGRRALRVSPWLAGPAWLAVLALLPWWVGLPLLLAMVAALLVPHTHLDLHAPRLRRGLRWGLPGMLLAAARALGGDAVAWSVALLGALAGYTLLVLLEQWLDRGRRAPGPVRASSSPDWPELALAPAGPPAAIIELEPPQWQDGAAGFDDPRGGRVRRLGEAYLFPDGRRLEAAGTRCCFGPAGRWFCAESRGACLLWRRGEHDRLHRLRGWQLCGWHEGGPWLWRAAGEVPVALKDVLGEGAAR